MESSTQTGERSNKHKHNKTFTYTKLRCRFLKRGTVKRVEATSLPNCVFFEVVRKCSSEISQQLTAEPTTDRKTATFSTVILSPPKNKKCYSCSIYIYIFFSLSLFPLGVSENLTQEKQASEALLGAYDQASFQKNVKNVKDFSLLCHSHRLQQRVFKVEHPVATATRIGHLSQRWKQDDLMLLHAMG